MTEMQDRGLLNMEDAIICDVIECKLKSEFLNGNQCQPKVVIDGLRPRKLRNRKLRIRRDYGSQIPEHCPLEYNKP